jgi:hypothetical protein
VPTAADPTPRTRPASSGRDRVPTVPSSRSPTASSWPTPPRLVGRVRSVPRAFATRTCPSPEPRRSFARRGSALVVAPWNERGGPPAEPVRSIVGRWEVPVHWRHEEVRLEIMIVKSHHRHPVGPCGQLEDLEPCCGKHRSGRVVDLELVTLPRAADCGLVDGRNRCPASHSSGDTTCDPRSCRRANAGWPPGPPRSSSRPWRTSRRS